MKSGLTAGLALVIGYFLGRHRKFKLAVALAVAGATGRLGGLSGNLVEQGMKLLGSSPDVQKIVDSVRGDLFEAGKAAAKAAAGKQVSSISTRLQERADALQHAADVAAGVEEAGTAAAGTATRAAGGAAAGAAKAGGGLRERALGGFRAGRARLRPAPREESYEDEDEYETGEYDDGGYEEERERPRGGRPGPRDRTRDRGGPQARRPLRPAEEEGRDEEPDEERPARRRVVRDEDRSERRSRPVRRAKG